MTAIPGIAGAAWLVETADLLTASQGWLPTGSAR